jgi:hypothetical protein
MGETDLTAAQVQHLVQQMGHHYKGNKYHLLQLNCNHFASDMCLQLTGKPAPPWVSTVCTLHMRHSTSGHIHASQNLYFAACSCGDVNSATACIMDGLTCSCGQQWHMACTVVTYASSACLQ